MAATYSGPRRMALGARGTGNGEFMPLERRIAVRRRTLTRALLATGATLLAWAAVGSTALARGTGGGALAHAARVGSVSGSEKLRLVLPLVADDAGLRAFATAVTTVGSPEYAQYASISQLATRFGASARDRTSVLDFLRSHGARDVRIDATGLFADATMSAGTADRVFATSLASFRSATDARFTAPASPVSLPAGLRGLVTGVVGLDTMAIPMAPTLARLPREQRASARASVRTDTSFAASDYQCSTAEFPTSTTCLGAQSGCAGARSTGGFTPQQYLTAYGYEPLRSAYLGQGERVALIEIDGFKGSDINTFANCFGLPVPRINGFGLDGLKKPLAAGGESTLDLEVLDSVAPDLKSIDVYEAGAQPAQTLQALTAPLQNAGYKPDVISASLGLCELYTDREVGRGALNATEAALEEAAASGISFVAASGDSGSADCTDGSGTPQSFLAVNFPASSPWVTGVGGTNFTLTAANTIVPGGEVVWNDTNTLQGFGGPNSIGAGGGGISSLFGRPAYQSAVVPGSKRAVPDVAMLADISPGYAIYCTAKPACVGGGAPAWQPVGGTSAATPLLAGGLALIDEALRLHKQQPLGLINPLLYSIGSNATLASQVFNDVTYGSNDVGAYVRGIGRPLGCCTAGVGYDEASGWGSLNLNAFATQALATQPQIVDISLTLPGRQRPAHAGHIAATVSCSGQCLSGAAAEVAIGKTSPFRIQSALYHLAGAGTRTVSIGFNRRELGRVRAALARHTRILAYVQAAILDPDGFPERTTNVITLRIGS